MSPTEQQELRPHFPPVLGIIANKIGVANALKLVDEFGGLEISVPQMFKPHHRLALLIGAENVTALNRLIYEDGLGDGLRRIEIPNGTSIRNRHRAERIREAVANGASKTRVARRFGVTTRAVRKICNQEF